MNTSRKPNANAFLDLSVLHSEDPESAIEAFIEMITKRHRAMRRHAFLVAIRSSAKSRSTSAAIAIKPFVDDFDKEIEIIAERGTVRALAHGLVAFQRLALLTMHPDALVRAYERVTEEKADWVKPVPEPPSPTKQVVTVSARRIGRVQIIPRSLSLSAAVKDNDHESETLPGMFELKSGGRYLVMTIPESTVKRYPDDDPPVAIILAVSLLLRGELIDTIRLGMRHSKNDKCYRRTIETTRFESIPSTMDLQSGHEVCIDILTPWEPDPDAIRMEIPEHIAIAFLHSIERDGDPELLSCARLLFQA